MGIIFLILFGIPSAIIAKTKGFGAIRWFLALGIIGLITVACLSSANDPSATDEERQRRLESGNSIGGWMCGINLGLSALLLCVLFAASR